MTGILGRAFGSVVAPVVECVDVDGVIQRIDLDEALSRVDLDAVLDRIDVDRLLDRVDLNRHLDRVDLNASIDRVDVDRLVDRSNISAIVARSSSGVFGSVLDSARSQLVRADQAFQRWGRCACCRSEKWELPPTVGSTPQLEASFPNKSAQLALGVQGRYSGIFARGLAWFFDQLMISIVFTIILLLVETLIRMASATFIDLDSEEWVFVPVLYLVWWFIYTAGSLAATGRTIGLALCGLYVVKTDGSRIPPCQALLRTLLVPVNAVTIVGVLLGWVRKDGRMLHDFMVCTGVVFSWDAKLQYLRAQADDEKEQDV